MTTTRLLLVRHGQTDYNKVNRYQGQNDIPLNDTGRAQVRATAQYLSGVRAAALYTSDLIRSRESAALIGEVIGLEPIVATDLRERSFGRLEGLTWAEAAEQFPENWAERSRLRADWVPPGGEALQDLWSRVLGFVHGVWRRHAGETVIIVSHGGPMRAIIVDALGASRDARGVFTVGNASVTVIARTGAELVVELLDETCHLGKLPDEVKID